MSFFNGIFTLLHEFQYRIKIQVRVDNEWVNFRLAGPPPGVKISLGYRYDLCAGRITIFLDGNPYNLYLDDKPQLLGKSIELDKNYNKGKGTLKCLIFIDSLPPIYNYTLRYVSRGTTWLDENCQIKLFYPFIHFNRFWGVSCDC